MRQSLLYVILKSEMCYFIFRWDIDSIGHLPEYMKLSYAAILDVYKEIKEEMEKDGYQYRLPYAIEAVGHLYLCILFRLHLEP